MQLHLVGGFLGSGKTTAIIQASKWLMGQGKRVGVVTNDQGKYLVDTAFFQWNRIPAVEVTGGCFCCNYTDLEERLDELVDQIHPDVIFAESVGSCGDLVSTVIRPLQQLRGSSTPPTSFSVFTDIRLLQLYLEGESLPFSEDVIYIFEKQIEEAPILVLNKADLLSADQLATVSQLTLGRYPDKTVRIMNALDLDQVSRWADWIGSRGEVQLNRQLEMDYSRYGAGEARLAWLDEEIQIRTGQVQLAFVIQAILADILKQLAGMQAGIGHLKVLVKTISNEIKLSFTSLVQSGWEIDLVSLSGDKATLMMNARVEMEPEQLRQLIEKALETARREHGAVIQVIQIDCFQPGFPRPQYRI